MVTDKSLKINVALLLALALFISFFAYFLIIKLYVGPYLEFRSDLNRAPMIFKFYEHAPDTNKIYYWGSSSIKEDIDSLLIDGLDRSFDNYNLGNPASTPLRRVIELKAAIDSKPKAVVIGVGYMSFSNKWLSPYDQYALVSEYVNLEENPKLRLLFNDSIEELLDMNKLDLLLYKRKFIYTATSNKIDLIRYALIGGKKPYSYKKYNEDFKSEGILLQSIEFHDPEFKERLEDKADFSEYKVSPEKNAEKLAFEFMIQELLRNKIEVIIVNIPLNPNLLKEIPNEYKKNFDDFLDEMHKKYYVPVLDYTSDYDASFFYDGHHLNIEGKKVFSKNLGLRVIEAIGTP